MTAKPNLVQRRVGSVVVFRQGKNDATEQEWDTFLKFLSANRSELPTMKLLIHTDGGVATATQRKRLAMILGDQQPLVAVMSDAIKVRFAGATIALFQKNYRQYTSAELPQALDHLRVPPAERPRIEHALKDMHDSVA